ncbi:glycosyltransferase family 4 protein [Halobacillus sp. Marseille-P3879]|uniref:glycosyltransferase family 4 protein n=1 Tax=Halobacillus sp. Marseille-P3879 TaxID=2045014 RepID=UPI000C7D3ABF|nr:glycosyltransferase family 4 protein [Halobacillus sp. Marseille-P3879]
MKILLVTSLYPGYKGQPRKEKTYALHYFAKDWLNAGHEVNVFRIWPLYPNIFKFSLKGKKASRYKYNESFSLDGVNVNRITINKIPRVQYSEKEIYKVFKQSLKSLKEKPDIIVCHLINPSLNISVLLKDFLDIPLVLILHQVDINKLHNDKKVYKNFSLIEPFVDRIGFRNTHLMKRYNHIGLPTKKNFIVPSGIDSELIISRNNLQKKLTMNEKSIFIAASMIPLKNIDIVIKAFENLCEIHNDVSLKIGGDGPQKEYLMGLATKSKFPSKIEFLGYLSRESVMEYMEKSRIFVMVSSPETFGLVYLEAMAKGCITIGTEGEGIDGVINDGENGYLCKSRDISMLTNKLKLACEIEGEKKRKILISAVNTVSEMTQQKISSKYLRILNETISDYKR